MLVRQALCQMCHFFSSVTPLLCLKYFGKCWEGFGSNDTSGGEGQDYMYTFISVSYSQSHVSVSLNSAVVLRTSCFHLVSGFSVKQTGYSRIGGQWAVGMSADNVWISYNQFNFSFSNPVL